ncbi:MULTISPECIES: DUF2793 domain-containing protein [unclassified Sphingopyxis]|jgi:hypothetical protein|uniref:DUF2793 domain-containing protein n=1 Tax=unclassified Sphingopyxis TaxID=2614943 RepID=UPI002864984A|nr:MULTISPECIES: DUF2793 domain-containing protein [unclassified Sphingopyxis]MDR6834291.1 hypothetical protein [Sphingopyxis sp. BE122]MDR7226560.1 hypothetical protein [Sphingopyxis sp. BE259]
MTDIPLTPRFALPLLALAQAQKEMTHNEALTLIDALVHAAVMAGPLNDPPSAPVPGQCWLVGAAATGAWAGQATAIALWTVGGWRFAAASPAMQVTRLTDGARLRFEAGEWVAPVAISAPSGGSTADTEARSTLTTLIAALEAQGLLISG